MPARDMYMIRMHRHLIIDGERAAQPVQLAFGGKWTDHSLGDKSAEDINSYRVSIYTTDGCQFSPLGDTLGLDVIHTQVENGDGYPGADREPSSFKE